MSSPQADYVIAFVLDRHGLVGAGLVLGLLALLVGSIWVASRAVADAFAAGALAGLAGALATAGLVHTLVSLSMVPVTGIYMPLVGSGGSTLAPTALGVGLAAGLARHAPGRDKHAKKPPVA